MRIIAADNGVTVQGVPVTGGMSVGRAAGGAVDQLALAEAAALLARAVAPAIEMAGGGATLVAQCPTNIALTGAVRKASIDGIPVVWNAAHPVAAGQVIRIGAGNGYAYFSVLNGDLKLGAVLTGDELVVVPSDPKPAVVLRQPNRESGGTVRVVAGPQIKLFNDVAIADFTGTTFRKGARSNRQGVEVAHDSVLITAPDQKSLVSDFITVGDVQLTGDGRPYVLMADCQTIGGYPRIGTVIPADISVIAQAAIGSEIRFTFVPLDQADRTLSDPHQLAKALGREVTALVRNPADIADLLSYQLISGAITGDEPWL